MRTRRILFVLLFLALAVPSRALEIQGYTASKYRRFQTGFPTNPVENTNASYVGLGLDFSGVGWAVSNTHIAVTLVSPEYILAVNHAKPSLNSKVAFLNRDGVVKQYSVKSTQQLTSGGRGQDLALMRLYGPIPEADKITSLPIYMLPQKEDYLGLPVLLYGTSYDGLATNKYAPRVGFNNIDSAGSVSMFMGTTANRPGEAYVVSGDSGSPTLINANGTLALLGVHFGGDKYGTSDMFIPSFFDQINTKMQGYTLQRLPLPPLKILSITPQSNGHMLLQCLGAPNEVNNLQVSPDLSSGSFTTVSPPPPAADASGAFSYEDAAAADLPQRFYLLAYP